MRDLAFRKMRPMRDNLAFKANGATKAAANFIEAIEARVDKAKEAVEDNEAIEVHRVCEVVKGNEAIDSIEVDESFWAVEAIEAILVKFSKSKPSA